MRAWTDKAKASFWSKVDDSAGPNACWPWTLSKTGTGYGQVNMGKSHGPSLRAHRVAYQLANGEIQPGNARGGHGVVVLHSCDNRLCCNPKHLRIGTQADNIREMFSKGRGKLPPRVTPEMQRRHDAYPQLVAALRACCLTLEDVEMEAKERTGEYDMLPLPSRDAAETLLLQLGEST